MVVIGYIYKIENKINHKCYIGQSLYHPKKRWYAEIKGYHNLVISKAIKKYGVNNFDFSIVEECEDSLLDDREIFYIEKYNSYFNGYNSTKGGKPVDCFKIPYSENEIINYYINNPKKSCRNVANDLGIFHETVSKILKKHNISIRKGKQQIIITNQTTNKKEVFDNFKEAGIFLKENTSKYSKYKIETLRKKIKNITEVENYKIEIM